MPQQDGTGPFSQGPRTGRGLGLCQSNTQVRGRMGFGRGYKGRKRFGRACKEPFNRNRDDLKNYIHQIEELLIEAKEEIKRFES